MHLFDGTGAGMVECGPSDGPSQGGGSALSFTP